MASIAIPSAPLKPDVIVKTAEIKPNAAEDLVEAQRFIPNPKKPSEEQRREAERKEYETREKQRREKEKAEYEARELARRTAEKAEYEKKEQERRNKEKEHITLPSGNVLKDITTHIECHGWFVHSVKELVAQFKALKLDNERKDAEIKRLNIDLAKVREDLVEAEIARDRYRDDLNDEATQHQQTKSALKEARRDLSDLTERHQEVKERLRKADIALAEAVKECKQLRRDIQYKEDRIRYPDAQLKPTNESEDLANRRLADRQHYIYKLEQEKSAVETVKDNAEKRVRDLSDQLEAINKKKPIRIFSANDADDEKERK